MSYILLYVTAFWSEPYTYQNENKMRMKTGKTKRKREQKEVSDEE